MSLDLEPVGSMMAWSSENCVFVVRLLRIIVDIWPICGVYGRMIRAAFEKQGEIL